MTDDKNKQSYVQRRTKQLLQWDKVVDKLISRANQSHDKTETELRHHIAKIQAKKAQTEVLLRQLREAGNDKRDGIKAMMEKNWLELRNAFLKASAPPRDKRLK